MNTLDDTSGTPPDTLDDSEQRTSFRDERRAIEAILMVADDPVTPHMLSQILALPVETVDSLAGELATEYAEHGRGFVLVRVAGGYRFQSHADLAPYVERFVLEGQTARMSGAALETLAIVAYKQPISRAQIGAIRGVNADGVLRTLEQRGYVGEVARDVGPGQAVLFGTTPKFLESLGIDSLADLPSLGEFVPDADVVEALEYGLRFADVPENVAAADLFGHEEVASDEGAPTEIAPE